MTLVDRRLLNNCVPYGLVDSWGRYEMAGHYEREWARQGHGHATVYGRLDIARLVSDQNAFRESGDAGNPLAQDAWYEERRATRDSIMAFSQAIEHYCERNQRERLRNNSRLKADRAIFFKERALSLDPPISAEALELIGAYKRSIEITRPPTERAWKALLPKVVAEQAAAQAVIDEKNLRIQRDAQFQNERKRYRARIAARDNGSAVELGLLRVLADEVLDELDGAPTRIDPLNYVRVALRAIRSKYYEMSADYTAQHGRPVAYRPCLADARMVFERCLEPRIDTWSFTAQMEAKRFKCPGCVRGDNPPQWDFSSLICHIRSKHTTELGAFSYLFHQSNDGMRWLDIEWPPNLPHLARHQSATGRWDPHDESPYQDRPVVVVASVSPTALFAGRGPSEAGPSATDVSANIIYAASCLQGTKLAPRIKTSLAMLYALEKHPLNTVASLSVPTIDDVADLPLRLVEAGLYDIFDRSHCAACLISRNVPSRDRNRFYTAGTLILHFQSRHPQLNWWDDMLLEVTDREIRDALAQSDEAYAAFDALFPRNRGPTGAPIRSMSERLAARRGTKMGISTQATATPATTTPGHATIDHGEKTGPVAPNVSAVSAQSSIGPAPGYAVHPPPAALSIAGHESASAANGTSDNGALTADALSARSSVGPAPGYAVHPPPAALSIAGHESASAANGTSDNGALTADASSASSTAQVPTTPAPERPSIPNDAHLSNSNGDLVVGQPPLTGMLFGMRCPPPPDPAPFYVRPDRILGPMTLPAHRQNSRKRSKQSRQNRPPVYGPSWRKLLFDLFSELVDQEAKEAAAAAAS